MKITCEIIKDLLPLYYDEVCSEDSKKLVEEHLDVCADCRKELEYMSGELTHNVEIEKEKIMQSFSRTIKRIKVEHIIIGILIAALFFSGHSFVKYQKESQIGTTKALREERLQEANHSSVKIKDEYYLDDTEDIMLCTFDIYNGEQSGIAFFQKQENGSYQFQASCWGPKTTYLSDSYGGYIVFYLNQPNITSVKLTITPEQGESWTEAYETTGVVWIKRPEIKCPYSIEIQFLDSNGEVYEW